MHRTVAFAVLFLSAGFVNALCPANYNLKPVYGKCECDNGSGQTIPPDPNCVYTISPDGTQCHSICPSQAPKAKRDQLLMDADGNISNCPARTISCPIDATMNMGYECISPGEDLDNCGGCVALGQGISCEKVAGVKKTECSRGRCVNHSCRSGWVLDKRSNNCIPRPRRSV